MAEKEKVTNKNIMEITVGGKKYTLQKVKPTTWLTILDDVQASEGKGNLVMYGKVLENIVVSPKMEIDDFESFAELEEVVKTAIRFQRA